MEIMMSLVIILWLRRYEMRFVVITMLDIFVIMFSRSAES